MYLYFKKLRLEGQQSQAFKNPRRSSANVSLCLRLSLVVLLLGSGSAMRAQAQTNPAASAYPSKPIRFIVPFPAGSAPDAIARIVGQHMQVTLGQPMIIDNKPGAQGAIAAAEGEPRAAAAAAPAPDPDLADLRRRIRVRTGGARRRGASLRSRRSCRRGC